MTYPPVIVGPAPIMDALVLRFGGKAREAIVAWGDRIYNPAGFDLTPSLLAHEAVHCERQTRIGLADWWNRYLSDVDFMVDEEVAAHRREYDVFCAEGRPRNERRRFLTFIAGRLSGPLYGRPIPLAKAVRLIKE